MSFPTRRFETAGLSAEEIEPLKAQFDAAAPQIQQAMADRWSAVADADLGEVARAVIAVAPEPEPATEVDESNPEPALTPSPTVAADRAGDAGESDDPPTAA